MKRFGRHTTSNIPWAAKQPTSALNLMFLSTKRVLIYDQTASNINRKT